MAHARHARWGLLVALTLTGGCADDPPASPHQAVQATLSGASKTEGPRVRPIREARAFQRGALPGRADFVPIPVPADRQPADNARVRFAEAPLCGDCGEDRLCAMMCLLGEEFAEGQPINAFEMQCLACGRETGFLPRPDLEVRFLDEKRIELSWSAVPGAEHYVVSGLRWTRGEDGTESVDSLSWHTAQTRLRLTLEEGHVYTFYVVAWTRGENKRRSRASEPVEIEL